MLVENERSSVFVVRNRYMQTDALDVVMGDGRLEQISGDAESTFRIVFRSIISRSAPTFSDSERKIPPMNNIAGSVC